MTTDNGQSEATQDDTNQTQHKSFSQDEVNLMMGKVRAEERSKYSDYDALKAEAEEGRQLKIAQMSDQERLEAQLAELQRSRADADERIATALITSDIRVKAVQAGIIDPDAAIALIDRTSIAYDEDSGVRGVDDALKSLVETKPYLKGKASAPNLNAGGGASPAPVQLTADEREAARFLYRDLPADEAEAKYAKGKV